jgi:hypothetical protein
MSDFDRHSLARTSPKGGPFIGTCTKCGQTDLPVEAVSWRCVNPANITQDEALMMAIRGPSKETPDAP